MLEVGKLVDKESQDKWLRKQCREYIAGWCDANANVDLQQPRTFDSDKYAQYLHGYADQRYNETRINR